MSVVHSVSHCDVPSTLEAFLVHLGDAALTVWLSVALLHLPNQRFLAGRADKAAQVVGLEREFYPLVFDGLRAGRAFGGCFLDVALVAHDTAGHFVEVTVHQPGPADPAFEAVSVPASVAVFEIADTGPDPLLAPLALPDRFRAVRTDDVIVDDEVSLPNQILSAAFAHEALSVVVLSFHRQLLLVDTDGLLAPVTL